MRGNLFDMVGGLKPGRSMFDLSYEKKFTCDMGILYPILCEECLPGDVWQIMNQAIVRLNPLVAPVLHEMNMRVDYFFVPNRLMWDDWEDFWTGGADGDDASVLPTWEPTDYAEGSLWDYFGFPLVDPDGAYPVDFPKRAYNLVWNTYYRDETLQTEVNIATSEVLLLRNWKKDFYTSALPWQQRGTAGALPVTGSSVWDSDNFIMGNPTGEHPVSVTGHDGAGGYNIGVNTGFVTGYSDPYPAENMEVLFNNNVLDATSVDVNDLRLSVQIQKWQERNARAGVRYPEALRAHFGVSNGDARFQRPEFIGATKSPIIVSEVLQTSETNTTPQGNLAGHGINVSQGFAGKYRCTEWGVVIGIMSIMPEPAYYQGINRQWLKETRYDYYSPEFANLGEQAVIRAELFANNTPANNQTVFGYQAAWNELRIKQNMVCSKFRPGGDFDYWTLCRDFSSYPELNSTFIECDPRKDIFAAPSEPGFLVSFGNKVKCLRPLPVTSEPGLLDHF